ncbi:MAG: FAD:protein FMN transferase [Candidatus Accumulibacter sp.]|jgi:thiamine biosynthesis lipoprotein|nr:FAD:protein FMN transferase [Accumulibacter sp.]
MRFTRLIFFALLALGFSACERAPLHRQESFVFGTRVEILIAGMDEAAARQAASVVLKEFDRLHRSYHAWEASELSAMNDALASGQTRIVSPELAFLLTDAQRRSAMSGALFDPGIGKLIRLWGFHSDAFKPSLPDPEKIAVWLKARPGLADLSVDGIKDGIKVNSANPEVLVDLGGYLKGFALDRADRLLRTQGVTNALVNIGGNIMALGTKNGRPWRVGIQHPRQPGAMATVQLKDGEAIGTSGDYQRYFELDGKRYCHLIDPRTGAPVAHTRSLTILVTPRENAGTLSDAASKPLFIAGEHWPELAKKMAVKNVLRVDAAGKIQVSESFMERIEFVGGKPHFLEIVR